MLRSLPRTHRGIIPRVPVGPHSTLLAVIPGRSRPWTWIAYPDRLPQAVEGCRMRFVVQGITVAQQHSAAKSRGGRAEIKGRGGWYFLRCARLDGPGRCGRRQNRLRPDSRTGFRRWIGEISHPEARRGGPDPIAWGFPCAYGPTALPRNCPGGNGARGRGLISLLGRATDNRRGSPANNSRAAHRGRRLTLSTSS